MTTVPQARLAPPGTRVARPVRHRAMGCILGAAVGDALGAPFEFQRAGLYRERFPQPVLSGLGEMIGGGSFGWAPGEFTDDTQMALVMAASLLERRGYDPDHLWQGWREWARSASDVGLTTRHALGHSHWSEVRHPHPERTASNGALMRAFPLAVSWNHLDDATARQLVLHQAAMTHTHPAAGWGAWLGVAMMRAAIRGDDVEDALIRELDVIPESEYEAFASVLDPAWTPDRAQSGNGSVWVCLAQAVWAVRNHDTFEDAVTAAVDLGDDADTVACVTGALAGAIHGVQAIPARWATYVHGSADTASGRLSMNSASLHGLAIDLLGASQPSDAHPEHASGPTEVAPGVHAANLLGAAQVPGDWAVVSLCRTGDLFSGHRIRRQVYLIDKPGDHNPRLDCAVRDAVDAIDAFIADGVPVVVHCHGGRSRTGLVLKAWKMRRDGLGHEAAHSWLAERWPLVDRWNQTFVEFLDSEWNR